jgi:hypothetical protein
MSNLWSRFEKMLPNDTTQVVTVLAVNSDGTSRVGTMGGGEMIVLGTSVVAGNKAFVKAGEITGPAPNLTSLEIEV